MIFNNSKIDGVYEIAPMVNSDERGFFIKSYDKKAFNKIGLDKNWVQENHSGTYHKGTIRGFHFQLSPYAESKLIRCIRGKVLNVFVDLRIHSSTFGQWDAVELSETNKKMVYLPKMFANGFCILENNTELIYKSDNFYEPSYERQLIWNDEDLAVKWPFESPILSEKDKGGFTLKEIIKLNEFNG